MTGQASSQARHVVQPASSSSVITSPIILIESIALIASSFSIFSYLFGPLLANILSGTHGEVPETAAPFSVKLSPNVIIIAIGDSFLPVPEPGHTSAQRPHSTLA